MNQARTLGAAVVLLFVQTCVDRIIDGFLAGLRGWCIITLHGVNGEGWKPIRSDFLGRLLARLVRINTPDIQPAAAVPAKYVVEELH